ncbi:MAG: helix-turn-helix transcriptional regulator [Thermoleophilia bacterium]
MRLAIRECIEAHNGHLAPGEAPMTMARLAIEVGVNQSQISRLDAGKREPKLALAVEISKVLGCSVEDLFPGSSICQSGIHSGNAA